MPATKTKRKSNGFEPMGESDMAAIDRKLHTLLTAEGYMVILREMFTGTKLNNFTNIHRLGYQRDGYGVCITTQHPQAKEEAQNV
ncbi:MAG: hypothetical protein LBH43_13710 [Treponema sp.]|nr:hypothetical protein [Treponema sp.]